MHVGFYEIVASVSRVSEKGYRFTDGLPTFYLHSNMQGITSVMHAESVAQHLIQTCIGPDDSTLQAINVTARVLEEGM